MSVGSGRRDGSLIVLTQWIHSHKGRHEHKRKVAHRRERKLSESMFPTKGT